jgi:hypothetical protein
MREHARERETERETDRERDRERDMSKISNFLKFDSLLDNYYAIYFSHKLRFYN